MTLTRYGPDAWLLRFAERVDESAFVLARRLVAGLERQSPPGLAEFVPAFTTLLLRFRAGQTPDEAALRHASEGWQSGGASPEASRRVELPVHYAGPDLLRVAEHAHLTPDEVIERHAAATYRVHCLGFAPGFPYLGGLDPRLHTPRLASPRPRVPAGSVAIGGEHTGIYSIASPGGWNLIGQTSEALFKPEADSLETMFRLRAGDRVRFHPVSDLPADTVVGRAASPARSSGCQPEPLRPSWQLGLPTGPAARPTKLGLRILSPGVGLSVQDRGRAGFGRFGVPRGGTMDSMAASWANRLLENPESAAVLELCLQGQRLEMLADGWLAVVGSTAPRGRDRNSAFRVRAGEVLEFPPGPGGVWTCLAIPGGFAGERLLDSFSANPRAGIGRTLAAGDELTTQEEARFQLPAAVAGRSVPWNEVPDLNHPAPLRVWPGPQWDSFPAADRERFFGSEWTVSSQCDRVGYRLTGQTLKPEPAEIISEPVLPGSIQVPASGLPIVTMPDGPTIGGYPKLGLVDLADLPRLAQCRPGQRVRFEPVL